MYELGTLRMLIIALAVHSMFGMFVMVCDDHANFG